MEGAQKMIKALLNRIPNSLKKVIAVSFDVAKDYPTSLGNDSF